MTRDEFEQLICAALDAPHDAELAVRLADAAATSVEFAAVLREWRRFDAVLRRGLPAPRGVRWEAVATRYCSAIQVNPAADAEDGNVDAALDAVLQSGAPEARVNWERFAARVSDAAFVNTENRDHETNENANSRAEAALKIIRPQRLRFLRIAAVGSLALAAAVALFLIVPRTLPTNGGNTESGAAAGPLAVVPPAPLGESTPYSVTPPVLVGVSVASITPAHAPIDSSGAVAIAQVTRLAVPATPAPSDGARGEIFMIVRSAGAEVASDADSLGYF